ncbi:MAG: flagellin FliC [Planctomycetes bacterium]|nr:flagellin FliC [Planctomycetota bacterium]
MAKLVERQRTAKQRLASGKRIVGAADDASGLAMAQRLTADVRSAAQAERNYDDGRSIARVADGAMQTSHDNLARMRELAVQARNGTLSDGDRATVQQEYDQLAAQLEQTAGATRFAGRPLLDGSAAGVDAIEITDGEGNATRLDLADVGAAALGVAGRAVDDPGTLQALDDAGAMLASERASVGAADAQLERQGAVAATGRIAADEARSRIEDADVARELAEDLRDRILARLQIAGQRIAQRQQGRLIDDLM